MMAHVSGQSRYQTTLFPEVLDEVVGRDDPVRVIDAFVDTLDLAELGFSKVMAEEMGRPPYAPGDLLKLYIYGYLHRIRASRRLQRSSDVADQPADAGVQDHRGFPQGPCAGDRGGMPQLYRVLPGAVAVWRRVVGDRRDEDRRSGEPQAGIHAAADCEDE
jgi:hypothetical protein